MSIRTAPGKPRKKTGFSSDSQHGIPYSFTVNQSQVLCVYKTYFLVLCATLLSKTHKVNEPHCRTV